MDFLNHQQRAVVDNFGNHCKKLVDYGFAYAGAHPEAQRVLDCDVERIRLIEARMRANPRARECLDKMLREANIQYIVKVIKLGMKYVKNNPQCAALIQNVQRALNEYDRVRELPPKKEQFRADDDFVFKDVFVKLNEINDTLQSIQKRTNELDKPKLQKYRALKEAGKWDKFKEELDRTNRELKDRLSVRQRLYKQQQTVTMPRISQIALSDDDDDESASEVLVSCENYLNPSPPNEAVANQTAPVRVGRVERHLVIPVHAENPNAVPKITPNVFFKKDANGAMKFNVRLNFDERVMCNDKLVNSINIQNLLPRRNTYRRY